jgi:dihydrofolate reductase
MRKVYFFMTLSVDGYFEGKDHDISWHNIDAEVNRFVIEQLRETDIFMFGRRIYELMEASWPAMAKDPNISAENAEVARLINNSHKMVFSRTLQKVEEKENWRNVKLVHGFDPEEIRRLKNQSGKNISVGGSDLALSFIRSGLIDEFRFMISPTVVGHGTKIFQGLGGRLDLELKKTHRFKNGNMLLHYRPSKASAASTKHLV